MNIELIFVYERYVIIPFRWKRRLDVSLCGSKF